MTSVRPWIYVQDAFPHLVFAVQAEPATPLEERLELSGSWVKNDCGHVAKIS
jgi:hypothetical protein